MSTETQMEKFEEWASLDTRIANIDRYEKTDLDDEGPYKNWDTAFAWSVWQAALASQAAEIEALRDQLNEAEKVCAEAYQVVGSLLSDLGKFETPEAKKILDNLSAGKLVHKDVLPWLSYEKPRATGCPEKEKAWCTIIHPTGEREMFEIPDSANRAQGCPDTMDDTGRFAEVDMPAFLRKQAG